MNEHDEERWVQDVRRTVINAVYSRLSTLAGLTDDLAPQALVRTARPLPKAAQHDIRVAAREVRSTFGDGDGRIHVEFDTAADAPEPCAVTWPSPDPADVGGAPDDAGEPIAVDAEARLLVLGFGGLEFHHLLEPREDWLPLARPSAGYDGVGLVLPQALSAIPHGHLVDLSFDGAALRARRAPDRLDCTVSVNGVVLTDEGTTVADHGEIVYTARSESCVLLYELFEWNDEVPGPGTGADVLDGSPHPTESTDAGNPGVLLVAPPQPGRKAETRRFPLPTGRADVPVRDVHVQVLHTTATRPGSTELSHVKVYRCATPQHASYLRRYLATQADLIHQANTVAGRPGGRTWAVAPVTLVAATPAPEVLTARVDPSEVGSAAENRLSAWFGVPDQPQPDCFVIVASPLLTPVGWAGHEQLGDAPSGGQLSSLAALAAGVDQLHHLGVAHCDVRPQNVCHHLDPATGRNTYVLVDGDAVTRAGGAVAELRFTPEYASAEVIRAARRVRAPGREAIDLREHDRFGFVLVVLTALIGIDKVEALLLPGAGGRRQVDSPSAVREALDTVWSPRWSRFADELTAPFRPDALREDWSATAWLAGLNALWAPEEHEEPEPEQPVVPGRYGHEVIAIRTQLREERALAWAEWRDELVVRVRAAQLRIARREYRTWSWVGRIAFLLSLVLLVTTIAGGTG